MKINKKQEVAMWILGVLWSAGLVLWAAVEFRPPEFTGIIGLLIPTLLIIFSLRDRRPN